MPLVPAKCPECGGNINIDPSQRLGICEYCKAPFIVQEAIQNFNTTYNITNNNEIKADIVNVYETKDKEFEIEAGTLKKYNGENTMVVIPDGIKEIGRECFADMKYLRKVVIPEGVETISDMAFSKCGIEELILPQSIRYLKDSPFQECVKLKEVVIPDGIREIGSGTFYGCSGLEEIVIPDGIKEIGLGAFSNCTGLKKVTLPASLQRLEERAFASCDNIKTVVAPADLDPNIYIWAFPSVYRDEIYMRVKEFACGEKHFAFPDHSYHTVNRSSLHDVSRYGPEVCLLWEFITSEYNPLSPEEVYEKCKKAGHTFMDDICKDRGKFVGMYGHYVAFKSSFRGDSIDKIRYIDECFTNCEEIDQYIEKMEDKYLDYCKHKGICPYCRTPKSILGMCKNKYCRKQYVKRWED